MNLETNDIVALRAAARELAARVEHLEEHCTYLAKIIAVERTHELVPKTAAEIEAHRAVLRARIDHASDHWDRLAAGRARDEAALAALEPAGPPPGPPTPVTPVTPPAPPPTRVVKGGGGAQARASSVAPRTRAPRVPQDRRVQRKGS